MDFPVLSRLKEEGGTDYLVVPMVCSDGEVNAIAFLTDHPDGYSEADVAALEQVGQVLSIIVELQSSRRIAKILMDTYLGPRTGARVLSGSIARGSGESIRAVIWLCDLRGFTALADGLPRDQLSAMLNEYFGIMVKAVTDEGGEVLKFVGDGMLAIFELCKGEDVGPCCASALRAARAASAAADAINATRRAEGSPDPLRNRPSPGRSLLRQYRLPRPPRFHRHRAGGESRRAPGAARVGARAYPGDVGQFRGRRPRTAREPRAIQPARRGRAARGLRAGFSFRFQRLAHPAKKLSACSRLHLKPAHCRDFARITRRTTAQDIAGEKV